MIVPEPTARYGRMTDDRAPTLLALLTDCTLALSGTVAAAFLAEEPHPDHAAILGATPGATPEGRAVRALTLSFSRNAKGEETWAGAYRLYRRDGQEITLRPRLLAAFDTAAMLDRSPMGIPSIPPAWKETLAAMALGLPPFASPSARVHAWAGFSALSEGSGRHAIMPEVLTSGRLVVTATLVAWVPPNRAAAPVLRQAMEMDSALFEGFSGADRVVAQILGVPRKQGEPRVLRVGVLDAAQSGHPGGGSGHARLRRARRVEEDLGLIAFLGCLGEVEALRADHM